MFLGQILLGTIPDRTHSLEKSLLINERIIDYMKEMQQNLYSQ